jgi:5-methyltetrahydrofolate--homocysteine methyltransferase
MARTAENKLKIARRAYKQATEHGIPGHDIFFDPLALPISTGIEEDRKNADETIESIRQIKAEMPDANIILGVSNISFGLSPAARVVLNSVFLHDCVEAGMNSAIVNASKILPLMRFNEHEIDTARDLIYDRRKWNADASVRVEGEAQSTTLADEGVRPPLICTYDPLTEFTTIFEGRSAQSIKPDISNLPVEERLKEHIIEGEKIGLEDSLKQALEKYPPLDIINEILLGGMKVVGDLFGSGQMQLPFVLQSAEAMKAAVKFLEPFMEKSESTNKGTMVLATVKGDVHDIGKNLVDIILTNNGYKVVNLGIKQPIDDILRAWDETKCDAIGMSGLLVKSTLVMRDNLEIMNDRGINVPVILGGAALNRRYVDNDLIPLYEGKLFYARDAFDGLHAMDQLTQKAEAAAAGVPSVPPAVAGGEVDEIVTVTDAEDLVGEDAKLGQEAARVSSRSAGDTTHTNRSEIATLADIPKAPFYGSKVVEITDLTKVFAYINETALFKGQWQFKQGKKTTEEYKQILDETVYPKFAEVKAKAIREKLLEAKLVYGYFPCQSEGNDLIIYQDDEKTERMRFTFPRQAVEQRGGKNLCLADYFASVDSDKIDVVAFDLVTMGRRASEHSAELFKSDNYQDYLLFHGLSVESAEALAELWHKRIREELGIAGNDAPELAKLFHQGYQGSRYSFGYPACPNIADQTKLFELLEPGRIDVELTEEFMLDPEQSTSAIIVHHPEAKYFNVE